MPLHARIAGSFALLAIVLGALLTTYYQSRTESLLLDTADSLFAKASSEITLAFQKTYRPVKEMTSLLSRSPLSSEHSEQARNTNLAIFASALNRQPETVAVQIGYDNGDYYIVRAMRSADMQATFAAPPNTSYITDYLVQQSATADAMMIRRFLRADLSVISERNLPRTDYDPRQRPWYTDAMAQDDVIVTQPYAFFFFKQPGMTVARQTDDGRAVVATDITLESLSGTLTDLAISPSAQSVLYLPNGTAMAYSDASRLIVTGSDSRTRMARVDELNMPILVRLGEENRQPPAPGWLEKTVVLPFTDDLQPRLAIAAPRREILGNAYHVWRQAFWAAIAIIALSLPLTWLIARSVSRPVRALQTAVGQVSEGRFDFVLPPVTRRDEVGELTRAFGHMGTSLQAHIAQLQATTAAKERLESELGIAREIQMSMVPGEGELTRSFGNWRIAAALRPARAVGGDLFDVATLPDDRLLVVVGDVSDKGVPAALFMARTVSLLKFLYGQGASLDTLMQSLNRHLSLDNDNCMFVTLLCMIIDTRSGAVELSSAGHDAPVLVDDAGARALTIENGPPMGLDEAACFPLEHLTLQARSALILYTDGVTEAFNASSEAFGELRLVSAIEKAGANSAPVTRSILAAVSEFVDGAPQSDDITVLTIERS